MNVAAGFPAPLRDAAAAAVRSAFMTGVHRGSLVAAGPALAAALVALVFLPARPAATEELPLIQTEAADSIPFVAVHSDV
jgi:hypothetical protein